MHKKNGKINPNDWKHYSEGSDELYSYLKKKGKHQRAEKKSKDR